MNLRILALTALLAFSALSFGCAPAEPPASSGGDAPAETGSEGGSEATE